MAFNGNEAKPISLEEAANLTAAFRKQNPEATKGHFFGIRILLRILSQRGCAGIRIYNGIDATGQGQLILAGADREENDQTKGTIAEFAVPCPPSCGENNPLNS